MATSLNELANKNTSTPLQEQNDYEESFASSSNCFCRLFCFPWRRNPNNVERVTLLQGGESKESWWMERLKKLKELSELVAGPKWKTFMRRFNNNNNNNNNRRQKAQFQYDPLSYALNFDGGVGVEDDEASHGFSQRFSSSGK